MYWLGMFTYLSARPIFRLQRMLYTFYTVDAMWGRSLWLSPLILLLYNGHEWPRWVRMSYDSTKTIVTHLIILRRPTKYPCTSLICILRCPPSFDLKFWFDQVFRSLLLMWSGNETAKFWLFQFEELWCKKVGASRWHVVQHTLKILERLREKWLR